MDDEASSPKSPINGGRDETYSPSDLRTVEHTTASLLLKPANGPKMPWEMRYEERRRCSKDPRVIKQLIEEDQWVGTLCSGIWNKVRVFALPKADWVIAREQFLVFLVANGAKGTHFMSKALQVFDALGTGFINGLVFTKQVQLCLSTQPLCGFIARHCFERFDRPMASDGDEHISLDDLNKCQLLSPEEIAARSAKKGKKKSKGGSVGGSASGAREAMGNGARYDNVDGLKKLVSSSDIVSITNNRITFADFTKLFLHPANGEWIGSFMIPILEVCVKYCSPPLGTLPLTPLRWLKSIEPLAPSAELYDADVVMLREIEATGIDPVAGGDKKKKKSKSASPKRKK